jgi:predicted ATPase/transcriptional regulator with XRE-family HTH domain
MDEKDLSVHFGDWLKQKRKALDLTQEELAQRAGCSAHHLRKQEAGDRKPSKQLASLLARALEIPQEDQINFIRMARGKRAADRVLLPPFDQVAGPPQPAKATSSMRTLPQLLNPLIGRKAELQAVQRIFHSPACRLLTVVGPGGIGKTRLAIEVALHYQDLFSAGLCFVPLASLSSPSFLIPTLADALGLYLSNTSDQKEQLVSFLIEQAQQPFMLVLDNLEHLLQSEEDGGNSSPPMFLTELLQRVTNLKLLVTSRERLYLQGEWTFELKGLPIPIIGQLDRFEDTGAVMLFVQRALQVQTDFDLTPEEKLAVVQICHMVEGSPLAIELAAAWTSILSCREIASEIESNLDFLATSMRDVPERHRSMRAAFDHSWRLLTDEERCVLGQLSVFQGGFLREAAEQVTCATLPLLASLVSKSLLQRKENGRFGFHEVIRQYALSHFAEDPDYETVNDRHCDFCLNLLREREAALHGASQQEAVRELTDEIGNVRTAFVWAIRRKKFPLLGQALRCFAWFCDIRGWLREGIEQGELAAQALRAGSISGDRQKALGLGLGAQGLLYFRLGQYDRAQALLEESLNLLRPIGDPALLPDKLIIYGVILFLCAEIDRAKILIEEGLMCAQAKGDSWHEALGLFNLGMLDDVSGRYVEAYDQMVTSLAKWRTLGDQRMVALALNFLSPTTIRLGRYEQANAFLQESLALTTQLGDRWGMGTAYRCLGLLALAQGSPSQAESLIHTSIALFTELGARWDIARALNTMGEARASASDISDARKTFLNAIHLAVEAHTLPLVFDALVGLAYLHVQAGEHAQALELSICALNHPASTYEAKDRAKRLGTDLKAQLTPQQVEVAQARARIRSFEEIMVELLNERIA